MIRLARMFVSIIANVMRQSFVNNSIEFEKHEREEVKWLKNAAVE